MSDWGTEERRRSLKCVARWLAPSHRRAQQRRSAWFILLAPYYGEPPSQREDLDVVARALGDPHDELLRSDLDELLACLMQSWPSPRKWTPDLDGPALKAVRVLRSHFKAQDWVHVPGHDPQRRHFQRREAGDEEIYLLARYESCDVVLKVSDLSESGLCGEQASGPPLQPNAELLDVRVVCSGRMAVRGLSGLVLRASSPCGLVLDVGPPRARAEYRRLLDTLPLK